jgi:hypothetical protein
LIARVDELLRRGLEPIPRLVHLPEETQQAVAAAVHARVEGVSRQIEDEVRVGELREQRRTTSTFSRDIAYSDSPAVSRAFSRSRNWRIRTNLPSLIVNR